MNLLVNEIINIITSIALSAIWIILYFALFTFIFKRKPSWISFLIGTFIIGDGAFLIENILYQNNVYSTMIALIIIAPITEETLKTAFLVYGGKIENALGIGLGFAFAENFLYFFTFDLIYQYSMILALFVIARGIMDPPFHSLTASIDSYFYKNKWYFKLSPIGSMVIHSGYNFLSIIIPIYFISQQFYYYTIIAIIVIIALSALLHNQKI